MQEPSDMSEQTVAPENARGWWSTFSAACLILAAPLLLTGWFKAAFVVAAVGCVAWFLNVRTQLKRKHDENISDVDGFDDDEEDGDDGDDGSDDDGGSDGDGDGGGDGGGDSD